MGRRVVSGGCHLAERKNGDFAALRRLSPDEEDKVSYLACTTTPCPTAGWPPVTWKGSGVHVPYRSPS
ncbi:unnamed protein product [Spirodela intermedia]|uniref:Uncharacterized protein n=1 Tax=Spirodela intermedia TaxID=51605 RepID=A0A7I8JFB6_SPIIN|nr:unnamed protein product [Spirodela intermedia]CAA6668631.1 unnamed protein product [Spirodela intermedia]